MASSSSTYLLPGSSSSSSLIGSQSLLIKQSPPGILHQFQHRPSFSSHSHQQMVKSIPTSDTFHALTVTNNNNRTTLLATNNNNTSSLLTANHHDDNNGGSNGHSLSQSMESINNIGLPDDEQVLTMQMLPMLAYGPMNKFELYSSPVYQWMQSQENFICYFEDLKVYEGSLLKVTNKNGKNLSPVGFVTFASRIDAETAKQELTGARFDPDLPATLRLEFAKSNTKVQKPKHPNQNSLTPTTQQFIQFPQELGTAFFPSEAWGQPLTFDLGPAGLHHPALLHTALHGPPMGLGHHIQGTTSMNQMQQSNQTVTVTNGQLNGGCSTLFLTGFPEHDFKNMSFALPSKAL